MTSLLQHLVDERAVLDSFILALQEEDAALLHGRFGELADITERQNELVERLANLDQMRERAVQRLGFAPDMDGTMAAVATSPALSQAWEQVVVRAERARQLSIGVQAKVNTNRTFVADAIALLQARSQPLYGPDGVRQSRPQGSKLGAG